MVKTDNKILQLKAAIKIKKAQLTKLTPFTPLTNCSLELDDRRYNLHTLKKDVLIHLLVKLSLYAEQAKNFDLIDDYKFSGFLINDWLIDVAAKLEQVARREKVRQLKQLEMRLTQLLSSDKQTELEVDAIAELLK